MKTRRLIHDAKDSFCELFWEGLEVEVIAGKIGTKGRAKRVELASIAAVERYITEEVARREKQGYVEVAAEGPLGEQARIAPRAKAAPELLADVLANPDEDAPRLVYADYLLNQGDPLGELIVLQCDRARLARWDPKQRVLADREDQLLIAFRKRWLGALDDEARATFHRGFVDRIRIEARSPGSRGVLDRALVIAPLLRTLEIPGDVRIETLGKPEALARLTGLLIRGPSLENYAISEVMRCKGLHNLVRFGMRAAGLTRTQLKDLEPRAWRALDFHQNTLGANGTKVVLDKLDPAALESLDIGSSGVGDDGVRLLAAVELPKLRELDLRRSGLTERAIGWLATKATMPALESLDLSINGIPGQGFVDLCGSDRFPKLASLDLSGTGIGDDTIALLAGSPLAKQLVELQLGSNGITSVGAASIAAASWPALRELSLSSNPIGRAMTLTLRDRLPNTRIVMRSID